MDRLTTNKYVSEMGMCELAHNSCYVKDGAARYRDYESDIDARDLTRELAWSLADIELSRNDDEFDEQMFDNLQYDIMKEPIGLIALFYRNLWAMADLREKLKRYEDEEEQGLLLRLPCNVGDEFYVIAYSDRKETHVKCTGYCINNDTVNNINQSYIWIDSLENLKDFWKLSFDDFKIQCFKTQAEAEQKLKEMERDNNADT